MRGLRHLPDVLFALAQHALVASALGYVLEDLEQAWLPVQLDRRDRDQSGQGLTAAGHDVRFKVPHAPAAAERARLRPG